MFIADDHDVVRGGPKSMLGDTDIKVVGEGATTGQAVVKYVLKRSGRRALGRPDARLATA